MNFFANLFSYSIFSTAATLILLSAPSDAPREIEFNTAPPESTIAAPLDIAKAYAAAQGLTSCSTPADAELDDIFLTLPTDDGISASSTLITEVGLDDALDSGGKRLVLLACD